MKNGKKNSTSENIQQNEQPKAVQNMQKERIDNNTSQNNEQDTSKFKKAKQPKNKNTFIKKYIIFILLLIVITGAAIYFTIQNLNNNGNNEQEEVNEELETKEVEIIKQAAEDAKFGIQSYSETYNENDLELLTYVDVDGDVNLYEDAYRAPDGNKRITYIQINGLKNKEIQNKINEKLKNETYKLKSKYVSSYVTANFSNILSVSINGYTPYEEDEFLSINIDLATGEDIPFEKVFVSSAPIKSYLIEGLYKVLAWNDRNKAPVNEENPYEDFNMDNADTSEYEDKSMILMNNYNKARKNNQIMYNITPSGITIYNLIDSKIIENNTSNYRISIDFLNKIEEAAIYKRYLTNESLFENNNLGMKNIIVLTNPLTSYETGIKNMFKILNYGKVSNNIFMEDVISNYNSEAPEGYNKIVSYFENLSSDAKKNLTIDSGKGMIYQRVIDIWTGPNEKYYIAMLQETKAICTLKYYESFAFKDYIDNKNQPSAGPSYNIFSPSEYAQKDYPNLTLIGNITKNKEGYEIWPRLYFSLEGEYLGTSEEEAEEKLKLSGEQNNIETEENQPVKQEQSIQPTKEKQEDTNQIQEDENTTVNNININNTIINNNLNSETINDLENN